MKRSFDRSAFVDLLACCNFMMMMMMMMIVAYLSKVKDFIKIVDLWCKSSGHKIARACAQVRVCVGYSFVSHNSSFLHTCYIKAQGKPPFYSYMCV